MPKTYRQSVEILYPGVTEVVYEISLVPIAPIGCTELRKSDGTIIYWHYHKTEMTKEDGTIYTWWSVPSKADCILSPENGDLFVFNPDGSILNRYNGITLSWSAPLEGTEEEGIIVRTNNNDNDDNTSDNSDNCYCYTCSGNSWVNDL